MASHEKHTKFTESQCCVDEHVTQTYVFGFQYEGATHFMHLNVDFWK